MVQNNEFLPGLTGTTISSIQRIDSTCIAIPQFVSLYPDYTWLYAFAKEYELHTLIGKSCSFWAGAVFLRNKTAHPRKLLTTKVVKINQKRNLGLVGKSCMWQPASTYLRLVLIWKGLDLVHALADDDLEPFLPDPFPIGTGDLSNDGRHLLLDCFLNCLKFTSTVQCLGGII